MTNRMLAKLARRVLEAFPKSFPSGTHAEQVGNPVRREIAAIAPPDAALRRPRAADPFARSSAAARAR